MKKMSKEMLERATHAKSADELKAMMTSGMLELDDNELATITGGADGSGSSKIRKGTYIWFIHKNADGSLLYEAGRVAVVLDGDYFVGTSEWSVDDTHFLIRVLDSEIYLYSNEL